MLIFVLISASVTYYRYDSIKEVADKYLAKKRKKNSFNITANSTLIKNHKYNEAIDSLKVWLCSS